MTFVSSSQFSFSADTRVGYRDVKLLLGQRQRILSARPLELSSTDAELVARDPEGKSLIMIVSKLRDLGGKAAAKTLSALDLGTK